MMAVDKMHTKEELRKRIWNYMEQHNIARFPRPVHNRIPNFAGSEKAAERLKDYDKWLDSKVIKVNPDSAQQPVREMALKVGKLLYMAVPRLREEKCFIEVRGDVSNPKHASTIKGAFRYGRNVAVNEMKKVDMVIAGCVAVNIDGSRLGKGGGYSDLEYGLARAFHLIDDSTPVVTTVHPCQIIEETIPRQVHDEVLDIIVTPRELTSATMKLPKPTGIYWDVISPEKIDSIPVLRKLYERHLREEKSI